MINWLLTWMQVDICQFVLSFLPVHLSPSHRLKFLLLLNFYNTLFEKSAAIWEWIQRPTARHSVRRESKLQVSIGSLPLELWEPQRRLGETVGVSGDGEHQENTAHFIN